MSLWMRVAVNWQLTDRSQAAAAIQNAVSHFLSLAHHSIGAREMRPHLSHTKQTALGSTDITA